MERTLQRSEVGLWKRIELNAAVAATDAAAEGLDELELRIRVAAIAAAKETGMELRLAVAAIAAAVSEI